MDGPAWIRVGEREVEISNVEKILYASDATTKGQVVDYYVQVAAAMLPHIVDRPLTMKRFPNGTDARSFFQKHAPGHTPEWVRQVAVPSKTAAAPASYVIVSDLPSLVWVANLGTIEFHVPLWHVGRRRILPAPPDYLVFDLDPGEGTSIVECCQVAALVSDELAEGRSGCRPKTSGSRGLQLYVPLSGRSTWDATRRRAHDIAVRLERDHPELVVSTMTRNLRHGKVLIDWSQNQPTKTTVAAYSLRGLDHPTASTPVTWDEVDSCARSGDPGDLRFTAAQVLDRVEQRGDLFVQS